MQQINVYSLLIVMAVILFACQNEPKVDPSLPSAVRAHLEDVDRPTHKWGYINSDGQLTIPAIYDDVRPFHQGWAAAAFKGLWGYIDRRGHWSIPPAYIEAYDRHHDMLKVMGADGQYLLLDLQGDTLTSHSHKEIITLHQGHYAVSVDHGYKIVTTDGTITVTDVLTLSDTSYASLSGKWWRWHGPDGQLVNICSNCQLYDDLTYIQGAHHYRYDVASRSSSQGYDEILHSHGQYIARNGSTYFLMDGAATHAIDVSRAKALLPLGAGRIALRIGDSYRLAHTDGSLLETRPLRMIYAYADGYAPISYGDQWGLIDVDGRIVVNPEYYLPWRPHEGFLRRIVRGGIGYEQLATGRILPGAYPDARDFAEGLAPVQVR